MNTEPIKRAIRFIAHAPFVVLIAVGGFVCLPLLALMFILEWAEVDGLLSLLILLAVSIPYAMGLLYLVIEII